MSINPYLWIAIVGGVVAFLMGCGVGMNDLANAFGTTYGARILTLLQICILASICEFAGAVSLGGAVTSTISGGIADPKQFESQPYVFMYGMLCAGGAAFLWLALATWLVLPVSSTHSVCGGVIGFALVYGGGSGVKWATPKDEFPFVDGVVPIIASWFISPVLTGGVAAFIYSMVRLFVLRPVNSVTRATYSLPIVVTITFFLEAFFVLYKGAKNRLHWEVSKAAWVAAIIGVGAGGISCALIPLLTRRLRKIQEKRDAELAEALQMETPSGDGAVMVDDLAVGKDDYVQMDRTAFHPTEPIDTTGESDEADCHNSKSREEKEANGRVVNENDEAEENLLSRVGSASFGSSSSSAPSETVLSRAAAALQPAFSATECEGASASASGLVVAQYASDAEYVYRYLQIFTAICASFAHGASDVSNAVGPFAAIYDIYQRESVSHISKMDAPVWILCIGGAGLVVGLSTFGARLMSLLGEKITVITPSRGFSAELAAALVVSFASGYGIPVSSTHCITGAVVAISIADVGVKKVKWLMVLKVYGGWVFTLVITALFSAVFFAQGVYTPNV